jgi:hypothetical protein
MPRLRPYPSLPSLTRFLARPQFPFRFSTPPSPPLGPSRSYPFLQAPTFPPKHPRVPHRGWTSTLAPEVDLNLAPDAPCIVSRGTCREPGDPSRTVSHNTVLSCDAKNNKGQTVVSSQIDPAGRGPGSPSRPSVLAPLRQESSKHLLCLLPKQRGVEGDCNVILVDAHRSHSCCTSF